MKTARNAQEHLADVYPSAVRFSTMSRRGQPAAFAGDLPFPWKQIGFPAERQAIMP
jgi:hypothetical protein